MAALGGAMIALVLRLLLAPYFEHRTLMIIYVPAVLAAAMIGGARPAMLATVLCLGISGAFLGQDIWNAGNAIDLAIFVMFGPIVGLIGDRLHRQDQDARRREVHLQSILDTVPEAMIVINDRGLIRSFSAAAVQLFGWEPSEAVGRNVNMLMPPPAAVAGRRGPGTSAPCGRARR